MSGCPRLLSVIFLSLLISFTAMAGKDPLPEDTRLSLPSPIEIPCNVTIPGYQTQKKGQAALIKRLNVLLANTTPKAPDISPQQLWLIATLADYAETGLTPAELSEVLNSRSLAKEMGWTYKPDRVEDSLFSMERGRHLVFADYSDTSPRFFARAEGVWEVLNAFWFHRSASLIANRAHYGRDRVSLSRIEADYNLGGGVDASLLLGGSQCVILASSARQGRIIASDVILDAMAGNNLGTPTTISGGYQILRELEERGLIKDRARRTTVAADWWHAGRRSYAVRDMEYLSFRNTDKGMKALFSTLYFYLKSEELLRRRSESALLGYYLVNAPEPQDD